MVEPQIGKEPVPGAIRPLRRLPVVEKLLCGAPVGGGHVRPCEGSVFAVTRFSGSCRAAAARVNRDRNGSPNARRRCYIHLRRRDRPVEIGCLHRDGVVVMPGANGVMVRTEDVPSAALVICAVAATGLVLPTTAKVIR